MPRTYINSMTNRFEFINITVFSLGAIGLICCCGCYHEVASRSLSDPSRDAPAEKASAVVELPEPTLAEIETEGWDDAYRQSRQQLEQQIDNPLEDGWPTEVLQEEAKQQLKKLGKFLAEDGKLHQSKAGRSKDSLQGLLTKDFVCEPLRPNRLETVYRDATLLTRRGGAGNDSGDERDTQLRLGPNGLVAAFEAMLSGLENRSDVHIAFKVFRIKQEEEGRFETIQYITLTGLNDGNGFEQNSTWRIQWRKPSSQEPPKLARIELEAYEETVMSAGGESLFRECTESVLTKEKFLNDEGLLRGVNHWIERLDRQMSPDFFGHQGVAVADVNGDGLDDVYLCQGGGLPNRLFVQNPDGTVTDRAAEAGVDFNDTSSSSLLVDLDNDGDQDMILCSRSGPATVFLENDGDGNFEIAKIIRGLDYFSPTAADFDADGDLDIYLCCYFNQDGDIEQFPLPMPFYDANNGGANALLRNDGNWQLTDVTKEVGLDVDNRRFSFAASWEDYDRDGDPDLYIANDYGRNNLYRNEGGTFVNAAAETNTEDYNFGMSVSWADYNRDGWMDIYISNMFSGAGNRIVSKDQFRPGIPDEIRNRFQRMARGNTLFENNGDGTFREVSVEAGVTIGRWAWGSNFVDINNDGWEDLVVANGYVTSENTQDL